MPSSRIAPVDATTREPVTYVLPQTVTITSAPFAWRGIALEQFVAPPVERHDWLLLDHSLTLHRSAPQPVRMKLNGKWQETIVGPGDFSLFPAGEARDVIHQGGFEVILLCLSAQFLTQALGEDKSAAELVRQGGVQDAQIERIALTLRDDVADGCPGGSLFSESLATALAAHLLTRYAAHPAKIENYRCGLGPSDLRRCLDFIHDRLTDTLCLADIAASVSLSPYHFARLFKQSTGQTPHQYVIAQRVEQAKSLLQSSRLPIGAIACAVGFGDQAHLNKHFKRLTGMTPKQYRGGA